jgi:hypothetical protein
MNKENYNPAEAPVHQIVGPHLLLRWEKDDQNGINWLCHYELVIPFREHDIRREVYDKNGEQIGQRSANVIPMGSPTRRTGRKPCLNGMYDAPLRDGVHAQWDSAKLGGLPIYVMDPDGKVYLRPNAQDNREPKP